jgi:hypothetical protein
VLRECMRVHRVGDGDSHRIEVLQAFDWERSLDGAAGIGAAVTAEDAAEAGEGAKFHCDDM